MLRDANFLKMQIFTKNVIGGIFRSKLSLTHRKYYSYVPNVQFALNGTLDVIFCKMFTKKDKDFFKKMKVHPCSI